MGDITTMTVEEYLTAPLLERLSYRLYRHPLVMFGIGPLYYFLLRNRYPAPGGKKIDFVSVICTNLAIAAIIAIASLTIGFKTYFLVQFPVLLMAATLGIWLFYIQHQFAGVYWSRHYEWDPWRVAMEGASYYQLPKLLQWATGNCWRVLDNRVMQWLGQRTYGIYLVHLGLMGHLLVHIGNGHGDRTTFVLLLATAIPLTLLAADLLWRLVEQPALQRRLPWRQAEFGLKAAAGTSGASG